MSERLRRYTRKVLLGMRVWIFSVMPMFLVFLSLMVSIQPFWSETFRHIFFLLQWIFLYFWLLYIPRFVPMVLIFVLGVLIDVLYTYPIGLHAIFLLFFAWVLSFYRRREWGWVCDWVVFCVVIVLYQVGIVWVLKWDRGLEFDMVSVVYTSVVVVLLYPLFLPFMGRFLREIEEGVKV
jgi:cell shape-determining protein MreD